MRFLQHPSVRLVGVAVIVAVALRALFFRLSGWLWHFELPVSSADLLPWARWAMMNRDGAEPYALVALAILEIVATTLGLWLLARVHGRWRATIVASLLVAVAVVAYNAPPRPPLAAVEPSLQRALYVVAGSLIASLLLARSVRRNTRTPALLAILLIPICFIPTTLPSFSDLVCILAPSLQLQHGIPLRAVYMQYDLLPSLLAIAWRKVGGASAHFSFVCCVGYFAMLSGLFAIGRRMFGRSYLVGPMVLSIILARMYASWADPSALPQVTPIRLDLWPLLLAATLAWGIRRWPAGLSVGLLFILSRSVGSLYVGAYALALAGDFFARRDASPPSARASLVRDLRAGLVETLPSLALIAISLLTARLLYGNFGSGAVALYRRLGVGMMRIDKGSFYWWLLPLTGAVGWLAFSRRAMLSTRRAEASIFAAALLVANSIYFFGRSHEHNLINSGTAFVFSFFLALDLAWPLADDPFVLRWLFSLAPYAVVSICAYGYSERVIKKLDAQQGFVLSQRPLSGEALPQIRCDEVRRVAGNSPVFFLSKDDFWYYEGCGYTPLAYVQPVSLNVLKKPLVAEINRQLDLGAKVFVSRDARDRYAQVWPELLPDLFGPELTETQTFLVYQRLVGASK